MAAHVAELRSRVGIGLQGATETRLRYREVRMKAAEQEKPSSQKANGARAIKRPYVKPDVRHEKVFETMALSCGKIGPTESGCHANHRTS